MNGAEFGPDEFGGWYDLRVRLADDDHYGHVNNARYYEYFDTAVNGWLTEAVGVSVTELPALGVVVASSCHFLRELRFPDRIKVGVRVSRIGSSSVTYAPAIFRVEDDETLTLCATGEFVHVYVAPESRRPVRIPEQVLKVLDPLGPTACG